MSVEFDLFNVSVEDVKIPEKSVSSYGKDLYKVNPDEGKDGIYRAQIRFLPNPASIQKSIVRKYSYWLENNADGEKFSVDCPTSVGEKSVINETFWKLKRSKNAAEVAISETLKRREEFFSYVYIINDPQKPEYNGTVKIFRYGFKVKQKLDAILNPSDDDKLMGAKTINPFSLLEGADFIIKVSKVGGFPNYDSCEFNKVPSPLKFEKRDITKADQPKLLELINGLETKLEDYEYKPWNDETREKVNRWLRFILGDATPVSSSIATVKESINVNSKTEPSNVKIEKIEDVKKDEVDDDIDSFLNDLIN